MNGEMMNDRRIPEWEHLDAVDKASPGQKLIEETLARPDVWT